MWTFDVLKQMCVLLVRTLVRPLVGLHRAEHYFSILMACCVWYLLLIDATRHVDCQICEFRGGGEVQVLHWLFMSGLGVYKQFVRSLHTPARPLEEFNWS